MNVGDMPQTVHVYPNNDLIVRPDDGATTVLVVEITDYHKR